MAVLWDGVDEWARGYPVRSPDPRPQGGEYGRAVPVGPEGEVTVSAFGDFWSSCRSPSERARIALPLLSGLRQARLRGRRSDVTEIAYRPGADGYIKGRDEILQTAIEGVTDR